MTNSLARAGGDVPTFSLGDGPAPSPRSGLPARRVRHAHVDAADLELGQHLVDAFAARFGSLGPTDPRQVIVALIEGTSFVRRDEDPLVELLLHVPGHLLYRATRHPRIVPVRPAPDGTALPA